MIIMATADSVKAKLQGLIDKSNATTGNTDADLTTAVDALVAGYGQGGGGGGLDGYFAVNFYNDDRTTLLYTVYVPSGSSAIYAGDTPISKVDATMMFSGFQPAATNVTADMDCFAVYEAFSGTLEEAPWATISKFSANGNAQNYFAVGDTKMIHIEGTVGTLAVNGDYGVYIIGFDHNSELEGKGITFGTFKTAVSGGIDVALIDSKKENSDTSGTKYFNMNHWGNVTYGGWAASDIRYDILGSTDVHPSGYGSAKTASSVGYDASATCATDPVPKTLMAALPEDLRAVMKPMTVYADNKGDYSGAEANVTASVDYLPFMSEFEVFGKRTKANQYEQNKQVQYAYFSAGNSSTKYYHSATNGVAFWWERSVSCVRAERFGAVGFNTASEQPPYRSYAIAPIFKV
jgi:hypothetical protein